MNGSDFKIGEHYRYRGQRFQVLDVRQDTVQLRATEGQRVVLRQTVDILVRAMKRGDLVKTQEAALIADPQKILAGLPKRYLLDFDRRLHYVQGLMARFHGHMPKDRASLEISELAKRINDISIPSFSTARRWIKAFCTSGLMPTALIPHKRQKSKHRLERQPREVQQLILQQMDALYLKPEPACKTEVIDAIILALRELNDNRPSHDRLKVPSPSTLNRIILEHDAYERTLAQKGSKYAQRQHGWTRKRPRPARLFALVEADTQQMHVLVVDEEGQVIGRPYLTAFLEVSTRMPIAWTIGFNPPSLDTTLKALKLSMSSDNPFGGVAERYVFDSGAEFIGDNLRRIIGMLGGEVCYCEPGTGNQKPHIEAFFGVWSKEIAHMLPGTTFSNIAARGDYNSEDHACLTLKALDDIFSRWVKEVYCERIHSSLNTSPRMAWEAAQNPMFPPRRHSLSELHHHFLRAFTASAQQGRLRHKSLFWTGPAVAYLANREPKAEKLVVFYDPSDLGKAWASHPSYPEELMELQPVDPDYQEGLTLHLHQETVKRLRAHRQSFDSGRARAARVEILRDLAYLKTTAKRRKYYQTKEHGSLEHPKKFRLPRPNRPQKPDNYRFHGKTPGDDAPVEV
ncbi:DDE-type integrase/transposase/recombinase [Pseudomonas pudica]|uniref:DDE-type integrase/transposase/recombinase n=1 Tax=Pseudomonas pudica TaxID=272772 RepID=A0ABS0FUL7_9PSED|nr:DDE-type integrase/transposase/recombinase [Pseudomonas pudica]MBF8644070.1 DDE-type integrase/transposase/recombinase [Pseudomonas pudica]MBF8758563.1 DDE-type integrase/transposase/recombinase [Pseudomonas pudica]